MYFDAPSLNWGSHIDELKRDCSRRLDVMKNFSSSQWGASTAILKNFYITYIRAKLDYGSTLYGSGSKSNLKKIEIFQNAALRLLLGARRTSPIISLEIESGILPLGLHREYLNIKQIIKLRNKPSNYETTRFLNLGLGKIKREMYPFKSFVWRSVNSCNMIDMPSSR